MPDTEKVNTKVKLLVLRTKLKQRHSMPALHTWSLMLFQDRTGYCFQENNIVLCFNRSHMLARMIQNPSRKHALLSKKTHNQKQFYNQCSILNVLKKAFFGHW